MNVSKIPAGGCMLVEDCCSFLNKVPPVAPTSYHWPPHHLPPHHHLTNYCCCSSEETRGKTSDENVCGIWKHYHKNDWLKLLIFFVKISRVYILNLPLVADPRFHLAYLAHCAGHSQQVRLWCSARSQSLGTYPQTWRTVEALHHRHLYWGKKETYSHFHQHEKREEIVDLSAQLWF